MAQNLDPNSDGRGVLQFKTGLMSVIKVFFSLICQFLQKDIKYCCLTMLYMCIGGFNYMHIAVLMDPLAMFVV